MNYICTNPKSYKLTEGKSYTTLLPEEDGRIAIKNDANLLSFYSSSLFRIEDEEDVPTPAEQQHVDLTEDEIVNSITVRNNRVLVMRNVRNETVEFNMVEVLNADSRLEASCGVGDTTGLNNLVNRVEEFVNNNFDTDADDWEDLRNKIFNTYLRQELTRLHQLQGRAMFLLSTAVNDISNLYVDVLDIMSDFKSSEINNPNSGNIIKLWGFETTDGTF